MTEDYKENLIKYITGNLDSTSPTTDELIKEAIEVPRSNWRGYMPNGWNNFRIEGFLKPTSSRDLGVMYGGYKDTSNNPYGFIILVDTNMNPVKYITEFSSGTKLRYIQCMMQGEDNLFYAIDDAEFTYKNLNIYNTQKRFLMLNNFTSIINNDYKVELRKSYILNGANYQNFYCKEMYKESGSSHFVFVGWYAYDNTSRATRIKAIDLVVNVGESNEWHYYQVNENITGLTSYVTFDSSNKAKIQILGIPVINYYIYVYTKDYSGNSFSRSTIQTLSYKTYINFDLEQQALFMNENEVYFIVDTQDVTGSDIHTHQPVAFARHLALYHYNFSTTEFETIYDNYMGTTTTSMNVERMQIDSNEGKLYIAIYNNFGTGTADYYFQRYEGTWDPILAGQGKGYAGDQRGLYVANKFNLLQIVLYPVNLRGATWYFFIAKEIYNPTQYNGEPYINSDVLVPLYSNLYSGESLVFSRNLYNVTKQNNQTMSSVEIPNTYLNDTSISQNDLISKTNLEMNSDNTNWNKNIYEVVDLNFINIISVIDEDTNTPYLQSAIKINNSISDGGDTNYQNTPCNKYRINYSDGTKSISTLEWSSINKLNKTTLISFYADKLINSIDLISNDETTIYLNIPVEVEVGKYYTITQKVRIGDKPTPVQLQYNSEDILYNNQPVMVYTREV